MRQIHFVQCFFVRLHIYVKADVFDAVDRVMLRTGDDAVVLHGFCEGDAHFRKQKRIFAVGLLRSAPTGIAQKIDADAGKIVAALRNHLVCHGAADLVFERVVKRGAARHGNRKTRAVAHYNAARSVGKRNRRNAEPFYTAAQTRTAVVFLPLRNQIYAVAGKKALPGQHVQLFLAPQRATQRGGNGIQLRVGWIFLIGSDCLLIIHGVPLSQTGDVGSLCVTLQWLPLLCWSDGSARKFPR